MAQNKAIALIVTVLVLCLAAIAVPCFYIFRGFVQIIDMGSSVEISRPSEIADYKKWDLVTPNPITMDPALAQLCANTHLIQGGNGHGARFFRVYVNSTGEKAMLKGGTFPVGSKIVKEKLIPDGDGYKVELLTAMIKRSSKADGWDFYVADVNGDRTRSPKELQNCTGCHQDRRAQDYVFRTYVKH